jgi:hypothetical protein
MLASELFEICDPPTLHLILHRIEREEADDRLLSLSISPRGEKSLHINARFSRYAPEASVLRAVEQTVAALATAQKKVTQHMVSEILAEKMCEWVEPF